MTHKKAISCIVPTYNGAPLLKKHIYSVISALHDGDQLIIIDDASSDTTLEWLTEQFDLRKKEHTTETFQYVGAFSQGKKIEVVVLVNQNNLRFAKSVNTAVTYCKNNYFFLVNNDVFIDNNAITILREQIQSDDNIFAIGCLEYEQDISGEKSGKNKLWFEKGLFQHSKADSFESGETAWASGGSSIFSTSKWRTLEGFDEVFYPAYWEDTDISFRARENGWLVLFNNQAIVFHQHESTNSSVFGLKKINEISWQNAYTFTWKNGSAVQRVLFLCWLPYWQLQRLKHTIK